MASIDLLFGQAANPPGGPVEIIFGDDDGGVSPGTVELQAVGRITGLRGYVAIRTVVLATAVGRITGMRGHVPVAYDINVERPVAGPSRSAWQAALPLSGAVQARYEQALPVPSVHRTHWQDGDRLHRAVRSAWQDADRLASLARQGWHPAVPLAGAPSAQRFEDGERRRAGVLDGYADAVRRSLASAQRYEDATRLRRLAAQRYEQGRPVAALVRSLLDIALPLGLLWRSGYQEAGPPRAGVTAGTQPPRPDPCYVPALPAHLVFDAAADRGLPAHLVFVCDRHGGPEPGETIVIPVQRTYIVINDITLHRVDTGAELRAHSFSMSLDYQSWTWSWSASLHHDAAAHLGRDGQGDPAELEVVVNGVAFRLRLERITRDRRFLPQVRWSVSGKGKASILGAPYAPAMSFSLAMPRTAQQLAADVLTVNGVGMGWGLDWQIVDWLVPAGAWALQGTYIDAINDIATAAGGYVQPHATDPVLRVLPRYPAAPWAWGGITPDFEIPGAAAEVVGTEYVDRPGYNRVFLGGISTGVFGPFSRAGTAGNVLAPQVNHALITHADVHRARGIAELSDTGRQEHVTLRMQVLPETGVIVPGQFVRHVGDQTVMGIVRSTSIDWNRPTLRQTLSIKTHA